MKKLFFTTAMFILFASVSIAQTRALDLGEFTEIRVGQTFQVQLIQADRNEIIVPENLSDTLFTVNNGTLRIHGPGASQREPIIIIFKSLDTLAVSGTARVSSENEITGSRLRLRLSGASQTRLALAYENVASNLSGAAQLNLSGTISNRHRIIGESASFINAEQLETPDTDIHLSGAARANINTKTATGTARGTSVIHFNPDVENLLSISTTARVWPDRRQNVATQQRPANLQPSAAQQRSSEGWLHDFIDDINIQNSLKRAVPSLTNRRFRPRYAGLDFGFGGFGQDFFQNTLPEGYENMQIRVNQSWVINWNIFDRGLFRFGQSNFGMGTGLGIGWNIYRFLDHNMIPSTDRNEDGRMVFAISPYDGDEVRNFRKSNLRSSWLRVPLFVQYQNQNRRFTASAGVVANVRLGASTKQVYRVEGNSRWTRDARRNRDSFYMNGFRLDTELRVTHGNLGLFASYSLTEMFLNNRGPELNAFSFGATLVF
ncbi:MAG: DUF2807 domain-containing protein [Bacteroidales bacterium]|nr:DUF2807 domain-containing protein [Bacteroidales bacterium]